MMSKVGQKLCVWARKFYQGLRINRIPLGGGNSIGYLDYVRLPVSIISIFKIDLAGEKGLIELELRYEMDIITFRILLELQIDSRYL